MTTLIVLFFAASLLASGDHHHPEPFSVNEKAIKNFGIECAPYRKETFPQTAIVKSGHDAMIYRCGQKSFVAAELDEIKTDEMVVTKGANFLKTIELSIEEGPAEGH